MGSFGPKSNFTLAGSTYQQDPIIHVVGSSPSVPQNKNPIVSQSSIQTVSGSQSILPQSVDSNRYSNPDGLLDGIYDHANTANGSALQVFVLTFQYPDNFFI